MPATQTPVLLISSKPGRYDLFRRRWRLDVIDGPDKGEKVRLRTSPSLIGAAPAAALVLSDDSVSRYHCELELHADGTYVRDLKSTNGTFLSGSRRIQQAFLQPGDSFWCGQSRIRVVAEDTPVQPGEISSDSSEQAGGIVVEDDTTRLVLRTLKVVGKTNSSIQLVGPRGAGKTAFAQAVHQESRRKNGPFVVVPKEIPVDALEAELFGDSQRMGALFRAQDGTLLIEEPSRFPPALQQKLRQVFEIGSIDSSLGKMTLSLRFMSTQEQPFSEDFDKVLAGRLGSVRLELKGLSDRPRDLSLVLRQRLKQNKGALRPGTKLLAMAQQLPWPRNFDGLLNALQRSTRFSNRVEPTSPAGQLRTALYDDLVAEHAGNVSQAARRLGLSDRQLFNELTRHQTDLGD